MTQQDVDSVRAAIATVDSGVHQSPNDLAETMSILEQYECWEPYFRLLKRQIDDPNTRQTQHFVRLARVQNLYLEDKFATAETCASLVELQSLTYDEFTETVLPQILDYEDWPTEAAILSAIDGRFLRTEDRISCLERLCVLYEKKTHNEVQLTKTYERLLAADAQNIKALRYFKLVYTQNNEWEEVVGILKTLLSISTRQAEIFRYAQELATIFLYQLDMADEAISVLEAHCSESPLDTSTIHYDAYERLGNWQGCLRVLRECLLNVDNNHSRAIVHFKIATIYEQLNQLDLASENFSKSLKLAPHLLDAFEGGIGVATIRKDWQEVLRLLNALVEQVKDERQIAQIRQAIRRLQDGMNHAQRT